MVIVGNFWVNRYSLMDDNIIVLLVDYDFDFKLYDEIMNIF